jgi:CDGSH-type Zn-finger protein
MTEPVIAQKGPYLEELEPGIYDWCRCGRSRTQPYCDGSHQVTDLTPLQVVIEKERKVAFCGCKHTKNPPFCDGTHKTLP